MRTWVQTAGLGVVMVLWSGLARVGLAVEVPPLKDGDVIVFAGDSLTEHGSRPGGYVRLVEEALVDRLPRLEVSVLGAGKGWDTIVTLRERFDEDVLRSRPSIVVIEIGINDLSEAGAERPVAQKLWRVRLESLISSTRRAGARPVLTTLSVVGEKLHGTNQYDAMLDAYSEIIRDVGREMECQVIEIQKAFIAYLAANNPTQRHEGVLTTDGAHFSDLGNRLFADTVLEALGVPAETPAPAP